MPLRDEPGQEASHQDSRLQDGFLGEGRGHRAQIPVALRRQATAFADALLNVEESNYVLVTFQAANQQADIRHGLSDVPSGYLTLRGTFCNVYDEPGKDWTEDLAFIRTDASTFPVTANLLFYRLSQDERETIR